MTSLLAAMFLLGGALSVPRIAYFQADPETIERGQTATLRWSVKKATDVRISPEVGGVSSTGTMEVSPNETTTYVLSAEGTGGRASASVTVTVKAAPRPAAEMPPPPPPPPPPHKGEKAEPPPEVMAAPAPAGGAAPPSPTAAPEVGGSAHVPGRDFLLAAEDARFGLFSYVLIPRQPEAGGPHYQRCVALIRAFLKIPEAAGLVAGGTKESEINVTYLPLRHKVMVLDDPAQQPEKYLGAYDYTRAAALLARMQRGVYDGPYLVSTTAPLSAGTPPDPDKVIFQDLSAVPPKVAELWMESFLNQASQPRFWEKNTRAGFVKGLVTFIAAGGEQISEASTYFASLLWMGGR